jgi:hypothetical protein
LFQQHFSEPGIRLADLDRIHQLLNVVIHGGSSPLYEWFGLLRVFSS